MKFSNPNMFYLIWLVVMLLGFVIYGTRKRSRVVRQFISSVLIETMINGYSPKRQWVKGILLTLSLFFLVLSLTGPLVGFKWEEVKEKGVDIMIALDCSRSMLATDIKPTRLEQAKREIIDLLNMMHSDRAGLVAFAGTSILQCPLTLDHSGFSIFLNALNPDYLPMGGTDISGAIKTAMNGFEGNSETEKAIILITDGENTASDPVEVATEAAKKGIRIFCIGVGQEDGSPIPDANGSFKKDDQGKIIMSKVDDEGLRKIAAIGNGIYVKSVAGDMDLDQIYNNEIQKKMEKKTLESGKKKVWENRFQWMLLPAILMLIVEIALSERNRIGQGY
ncbi:MAG: VWA domain-containing protein [Desulfamplus sp.]|nr:VWA domain-containing protein [Desulfamplus sp.]